ncbi:MAG: glucosaminidase domain-containing protein [Alphaproteobacteria bacterium]|nr:glucosaminidase domain-containing protein [Alphaproteobacteria bacterium]
MTKAMGMLFSVVRPADRLPWFLAGLGASGVIAVALVIGFTGLAPSLHQTFAGLPSGVDATGLRKPNGPAVFALKVRPPDQSPSLGYDLARVRAGTAPVPRILLAKIPRGLAALKQPAERKAVFLRLMLPLILAANERVLRQRAQILLFQAKRRAGSPLNEDQERRLAAIAAEYRTEGKDLGRLLAKVDAVPPSLALAQAAIESGWGTSRFIVEGNAPFGQWTSSAHEGLVPKNRDPGKTHKVRRFKHLIDSVHSYLKNLNTHRAYRTFRAQRSQFRTAGRRLVGTALVSALGAYSETKDAYIELLRNVIRVNNLKSLDGARLSAPRPHRTPRA